MTSRFLNSIRKLCEENSQVLMFYTSHEFLFPTKAEILAANRIICELSDVPYTLLDETKIDNALEITLRAYSYGERNIYQLCAILGKNLGAEEVFKNSNALTALFICLSFLEMNHFIPFLGETLETDDFLKLAYILSNPKLTLEELECLFRTGECELFSKIQIVDKLIEEF